MDRDLWTVIQMADLYAKGLPPVAGGSLDQSQQFVDAAAFIWRDENFWNPPGLAGLFGK